MTAEETLERANRAEKLVNDPAFNEAFALLRETILANIENAPIRDTDGVHELRLMLKILRGVRSHLEQAVRDGKVIVHRLEEKRRLTPADYSATYR
jgi:hypothetical protein